MKLPLTISLLASNRIASLKRCLDSLKPLLLQVPAELIVVFTGTNERVRQLAECYTDQIIPFIWCNDFSLARNTGLKYAKGEWFLYLDDDEWFDDVTEIRDFFQSGEYRHYHMASYIQRNYLDWAGSRHVDTIVYRMARRSSQLHFENPIHEELSPCFSPCKNLHSYVHHYGYLGKTVGKSDGKVLRNIPLLLEDIEKRPDYTKNYVQLAQEYSSEEKWDEAEKACRKGRMVCKEDESSLKGWLQTVLVEVLYKKKNYNQAKQEAVQILKHENPFELVRLLLFEFLIGIYEAQKDYEKLLNCGIQFESLLSCMERHPELWLKQQLGTMCRDKVMSPEWLYPVRLNCIKASLELKNLKEAEYFLELLPWEDECQFQAYYPLLDHWKEAYAPHLFRLLIKLPQYSSYLLLQKMLYSEQNPSEKTESNLFHRCIKEINQPYLQKQLLEKTLREKKYLSVLLKRLDPDSWKMLISGIVNETAYEEDQYLWEAGDVLYKKHPLHSLWLKRLLLEKKLFMGFLMKDELLETLEAYAQCIYSFCERQYHPAMFEETSLYLLPSECRMALTVLEALKHWKHGNPSETLRLFREILLFYPKMTGIVREILRLLKIEMAGPVQASGAEFEQLAIQMKAALNTMMQGGQYAEAMSVLSQLLPLLPNDMELLKLHQQLLSKIS